MKKKNLRLSGLSLVRLPITKSSRYNNSERGVTDLGTITSAHLFYECNLFGRNSILFCGELNKGIPLLRYYVRIIQKPIVLLTPNESVYHSSGLRLLFHDYCLNTPSSPFAIPSGNGNIFIKDDEAAMELADIISDNADHAFVFCSVEGLQINEKIFNALSRTGEFFVLTNKLNNSTCDGFEINDFIRRFRTLFFYPSADAEWFLVPIIAKYENERVRNNLTFGYYNFNGNTLDAAEVSPSKNRSLGFNINQSRELSIDPVLNEAQINAIRKKGQLIAFNTIMQQVYVCKLMR